MRHFSILLSIAAFCLLLCAPASPAAGAPSGNFRSGIGKGERHPWSNQDFRNDPSQFHFAIMADRTGGARAGVFEDAIRKVNLLRPEFVINVGDMIEGYSTKRPVIEKEFDEVDALAGRFDMPFFMVPGNHDVEGELSRTIWKERYGCAYYSFVYKNVLFLCLDSLEGPGQGNYVIGDKQVEYFRKALRDNARVRWTCVFLHVPSWTASELAMEKTGWAKMDRLLKDRPHTVFAGHYHQYAMFQRNGTKYFRLATTGGSSTDQWGAENGVLDQVVWVTMTDKGPRIANLDLSGIYDEKWRTEESLKLRKSFDCSTAPILIDTPLLSRATTLLRLANRADLPATAHLDLKGSRIISVTPEKIDVTLPAHTSQTVPVSIASAIPLKPSLVDPIQISGAVTYESKDSGVVKKTLAMSAGVVEGAYPLPLVKNPIVVDAKLDEWGPLPYAADAKEQVSGDKKWKGPADASFHFGVQRDEKFVYLAVEATDDTFAYVPSDPGHVFYTYDGLSLTFDVQPGSDSDAKDSRDADNGLLQTWVTPGDPGAARPALMLPGHLKPLPLGSKLACLRTAKGYALEMSVPIAYIERFQGAPWKAVRINVQMVDADKTGAHPVGIVLWRPREDGADIFMNRTAGK